jgi:hypothetical protein
MSILFTVSLDNEPFDHKPDKRQYKDYLDKFGNPRSETSVLGSRIGTEVKTLDIQTLGEFICKGHTWSPFTFKICPDWKRRRRLEGLFQSSQVFALDFDNNQSLGEILSRSHNLGLNFSLIHESFSSTNEHKKYRGILLCDKELTDFDDVKKISVGLALLFDSDKACVDTARLYFGSKAGAVVYTNGDDTNSIENLLEAIKNTGAEKFLSKYDRNLTKDDSVIWGDLNTQKDLFAKIKPRKKLNSIKRKINGILADIENFEGQNGQSRYDCVWRNTSRLARMPELAGGFVRDLILTSIKTNEYFDDWEHSADHVIHTAINWSATHADEPF